MRSFLGLATCESLLLSDRTLTHRPNGLGAGLGSVFFGRTLDRIYQKEKRRVGGDHRAKPAEFRLERVRFILLGPIFLYVRR